MLLAGGERPVNDLVALLGLAQPQVSKHLRVLREVGAVDVREEGRQRLYRLNGHALKPIHDWVKSYERSWSSGSTSSTSCWRNSSERSKEMEAMTSSGTAKVTLPTDEQILITREFDAPKHLVYKAWTTPELVKRWWSGRARRGDQRRDRPARRRQWRYVMVANEGSRSPSTASTARSSRTSGSSRPRCSRACPTLRRVDTLTLTEADGRTTLSVLVQHETKEHRDAHINSGMEGGMQEAMDLLEQVAVSLR